VKDERIAADGKLLADSLGLEGNVRDCLLLLSLVMSCA
jgi:hypothetical protein